MMGLDGGVRAQTLADSVPPESRAVCPLLGCLGSGLRGCGSGFGVPGLGLGI